MRRPSITDHIQRYLRAKTSPVTSDPRSSLNNAQAFVLLLQFEYFENAHEELPPFLDIEIRGRWVPATRVRARSGNRSVYVETTEGHRRSFKLRDLRWRYRPQEQPSNVWVTFEKEERISFTDLFK